MSKSGPLPATGYRPIFAAKGGLAQQGGLEPPTPCGALAFQASRLPLSHCCKFSRRNYFHTISSTATAQETGRTGKRVTDVLLAVRVGVEPTRQLSLSACFRDRIAQPLAILTVWRSEQESNLQAASAVRPISNRLPYQFGLITPSLITNSKTIRTHRRLALDQKKTICTYFEADLRDRYDAYDTYDR